MPGFADVFEWQTSEDYSRVGGEKGGTQGFGFEAYLWLYAASTQNGDRGEKRGADRRS